MKDDEFRLSDAGLIRAPRSGAARLPDRDPRDRCGLDGRGTAPAREDIDSEIAANPFILRELAKPCCEREHEIRREGRRGTPHGYPLSYPLSGRDGADRPVLFHCDERERFHADRP
jgi:hypothetical protein